MKKKLNDFLLKLRRSKFFKIFFSTFLIFGVLFSCVVVPSSAADVTLNSGTYALSPGEGSSAFTIVLDFLVLGQSTSDSPRFNIIRYVPSTDSIYFAYSPGYIPPSGGNVLEPDDDPLVNWVLVYSNGSTVKGFAEYIYIPSNVSVSGQTNVNFAFLYEYAYSSISFWNAVTTTYNVGFSDGGSDSYSLGYSDGYNTGLSDGLSSNESGSLGNNLIGDTLSAPFDGLNQFILYTSPSGKDVSLGLVLGGVICLSIFIAFLKIFAGG